MQQKVSKLDVNVKEHKAACECIVLKVRNFSTDEFKVLIDEKCLCFVYLRERSSKKQQFQHLNQVKSESKRDEVEVYLSLSVNLYHLSV